MAQHQEVKASLGCGTLILIAVIVMIFGGSKNQDDLEREIRQIQTLERTNHDALVEKIDALSKELKTLRDEVRTHQFQPERN